MEFWLNGQNKVCGENKVTSTFLFYDI